MKLINELQERWKAIFLERESVEKRADELAEDMQELEVALVALQGLHAPIADEQPELLDEPQEIEASSQSESCVPELGAETDLQTSPGEAEESRDQFEEEAERAAAIELTADVMPESGLHEEAPALNADMQDEREQPYRIIADVDDKPLTIDFETFYDATECMEELKLRSTLKAELSVLHEGENGEQERVTLSSFAEAEPQPDGYAPVTNPEADALARAHDWYSPEKVAERNKFNPWGIFGKKLEDA